MTPLKAQSTPEHPRPLWLVLGAAGVCVGAILRISLHLAPAELQLDEARVVLNIAQRSFRGLAYPLDHDQAAPILFLWADHAAGLLLGWSLATLRAVPLLCGITLLWVVSRIAQEMLEAQVAPVAVWIAGLSPLLIQYSVTVKQYGPEALVAACLILGTLEAMRRQLARLALIVLALTGLVAIGAAASGVFVLVAAAVGLACFALARQPSRLRPVLLLGAVWCIGFIGLYAVYYRPAAANPYLHDFWLERFHPPGAPGVLRRAAFSLTNTAEQMLMGGATLPYVPRRVGMAVLSLLLLLGLWDILRRRGVSVSILLLGPGVLAFFASMLSLYPIAPRLMLFWAPAAVICLAAATGRVAGMFPSKLRGAALSVLVAAVLVPQATRAIELVGSARQRGPGVLAERRFAGAYPGPDPLYVPTDALPRWLFYSTRWEKPDSVRLERGARLARAGAPAFQNAPSRGHPVRHEGFDMHFQNGGYSELWGVSTGMMFAEGQGISRTTPDPGWARNEVERLESINANRAWLFGVEWCSRAGRELFEALRQSGAMVLAGDSASLVIFRRARRVVSPAAERPAC